MLTTEELRIGNWVQDEHQIVQYVYQLWKGGAELAQDENGSDDLDYENKEIFGIPLTETIMCELGYLCDDIKRDNSKWYLAGMQSDYYLVNGEDGFLYNYKIIIKYLHQLQNLHFSLTGTELIIRSLSGIGKI